MFKKVKKFRTFRHTSISARPTRECRWRGTISLDTGQRLCGHRNKLRRKGISNRVLSSYRTLCVMSRFSISYTIKLFWRNPINAGIKSNSIFSRQQYTESRSCLGPTSKICWIEWSNPGKQGRDFGMKMPKKRSGQQIWNPLHEHQEHQGRTYNLDRH